MANLVIDDIVDVVISTNAAVAPRDGFNVGLILGKTVGTGMSATNRCIVVSSLDDMIDAGYTTSSNEYKAAAKYFAQTPRPSKLVVGLIVGSGSPVSYETFVEAITAARAANNQWYGVYVAETLAAADISAIAAYVETITACFFFDDATAADKTSATTDIFSTLAGMKYRRTYGLYSTTEFAGAAAMGFAMGANDGTANSAFTMAYKILTGVTPDDLTASEVGYLQGKNANYYVKRGGTYNVMEKGVCASGDWFDEVLGLDQLAYEIQRNCMDLLANTRTKVPYTNDGAMQFVLACNDACSEAVRRGFLAAGIWKGATILDLEAGDALPDGFLNQAVPVEERPLTEKALRICPPIYCAVILAGAIHSATIKVNVQ